MTGHLCDGFDVSLTGYILPSIIVTFSLTHSQAGFSHLVYQSAC